MKAGASSVWASCCGLLNEVMGSGAVRGQQPGFGPAAGPFRFAPSAAYTTYPPTSSGSVGPTCKACGLAFSVFRRKHICCDCKKNFCALCSVLQENLRRCATCHLLWGTAFQRPQLMRLRVKDLRQYLQLRNIPTDTCREKEDLVELVLCHQGVPCGPGDGDEEEEEEEEDDDDEEEEEEAEEVAAAEEIEEDELNGGSLRLQPPSSPQTTASPYACEQTALSAPQGVSLSRSDSSGTSDQDEEDDDVPVSLRNLGPDESKVEEAGLPLRDRERARISLSDLASEQDIGALTVRQLKEILARNFVSYSGCLEKWELVERVGRLYRHAEQNKQSLESFSSSITAVVAYPQPICNGGVVGGERLPLASQDDNLCRICMDAVIDCVLLECGHMVTCTKCGKRMNECPICRQYVVRAVHVFKS